MRTINRLAASLFITLIAVGTSVHAATAALIQLDIAAHVTSTPLGLPGVSLGDSIMATYVYESASPAVNGSPPGTTGTAFTTYAALQGISIAIGGFNVTAAFGPNFFGSGARDIEIQNDSLSSIDDILYLIATIATTQISGWSLGGIVINLSDPSATAFPNTSLPTVFDLADFSENRVFQVSTLNDGSFGGLLIGLITDVSTSPTAEPAPAPSAFGLITIALVVLAATRRHGHGRSPAVTAGPEGGSSGEAGHG